MFLRNFSIKFSTNLSPITSGPGPVTTSEAPDFASFSQQAHFGVSSVVQPFSTDRTTSAYTQPELERHVSATNTRVYTRFWKFIINIIYNSNL